MRTVSPMYFSFREIAVVVSAATLIFFCSCERHHPDELTVEEPAKAEPADHGKAAHEKNHHDSIEQSHVSPAPTPAEFFPSPTPH
jgi:hypothetical protein